MGNINNARHFKLYDNGGYFLSKRGFAGGKKHERPALGKQNPQQAFPVISSSGGAEIPSVRVAGKSFYD